MRAAPWEGLEAGLQPLACWSVAPLSGSIMAFALFVLWFYFLLFGFFLFFRETCMTLADT